MRRSRKRHVQQAFEFRQRGGKRPGAGRPPKGKRSSERHEKREWFPSRYPLHITTRVADEVGSLRRKDMYLAIREATIAVFRHDTLHIVQFSVQASHLHLIVEAEHKEALAKGMQAFLISAAKRIRRVLRERTGVDRRGSVFPDRYKPRVLKTPREVRHAVCYVLNNWRRHDEDRAPKVRAWKVDAYSSGVFFDGWKEREHEPCAMRPPATYLWSLTWLPKTWLLREGWKLHGLISFYERPGPAAKPKSARLRPAGSRRCSAG